MNSGEAKFFLKALEEEGVETLYLEKPAQAQSVSAKPSTDQKQALLDLREQVLQCTLCQELSSTRKNVVFGSGHIKAQLMFIGEAPGRDEDLQGLPFVGAAGQLLTKIIESIGLTRKQVFIANVLKCRPPGNRQPQSEEIQNCSSYLEKQITLIRPKIICALGTFAAQSLLQTETSISKLRGTFHPYSQDSKIQIRCTYHPAYLLRNPGEKRKVWEDMKAIRAKLAES